jgi:hypothetical protein
MSITGPIVFDFEHVKERSTFSPIRLQAGMYQAVVKAVDMIPVSGRAGEQQLVFTLALTNNPMAVYPYYCALKNTGDKDRMWKVYGVLAAAGFPVAMGKKAKVDPRKTVGKKVVIVLGDDTYEGREKSQVLTVKALTEVDTSELLNPTPVTNGRAAVAKKPAATEPDDVVEEEESFDEIDIEEL